MRVGCDGGEPAPGLAHSDGGRTQTKGGERSRADETGPGRGCATALSSAPGAPMYLEPESQAVLCLHICCSPGRAVLTALCISVMLSRSLTDVPEPLLGAYARTTHKIHRRTRCAAESGRAASARPGFIGSTALTPLRLRASAIGITPPRSRFAAITSHTHASARCLRQRRHVRSARMFLCP